MRHFLFSIQSLISLVCAISCAYGAPPLVLRVETHRHIYNGDYAADETLRQQFEEDSLYRIIDQRKGRDDRLSEILKASINTRQFHANGFMRCDAQLLSPAAEAVPPTALTPPLESLDPAESPLPLSPYGGYRFDPSPALRASHSPGQLPLDLRQGFYAAEILKRGTFSPQDIQMYLHLTEKLEPDTVKFLTASRGNQMNSVFMLVSGQGYRTEKPRHDLPFVREFNLQLSSQEFPFVFEIGRARKGQDFLELRALIGLVMAADLFWVDDFAISTKTPENVNLWIDQWISRIQSATVFVHAANQKLADHYASHEYGFKKWKEFHRGDQVHVVEKMPLIDFMLKQKSLSFFSKNWGLKATLRALGEALALKALALPQYLQYTPDASNGREGDGNIPNYLPFEFQITDRTQQWKAMMEAVMSSFSYSPEQIRDGLTVGRNQPAPSQFPIAMEAPEETRLLDLVYSGLRDTNTEPQFDPRQKLLGSSNVIYVSGFGSRHIPQQSMDRCHSYADRNCEFGKSPLEHYFSSLYKTIIEKNQDLKTDTSNTQVAFFFANGNSGLIQAFQEIAKRHSLKPKLVYNPLDFKTQAMKLWNLHGGIDRDSRERGATAKQWWPHYAKPLLWSAQELSQWDDEIFSSRNYYNLRYDFPTLPEWIVTISLADLARLSQAVDQQYFDNLQLTPPLVLKRTPLVERHRRHRSASL